jgi:hypothetical protein
MSGTRRQSYEFGSFKVDGLERVLFRDNVPVSLTQKGFDLLLLLIENSGHVVEKDRLMKEIWPNTFVERIKPHTEHLGPAKGPSGRWSSIHSNRAAAWLSLCGAFARSINRDPSGRRGARPRPPHYRRSYERCACPASADMAISANAIADKKPIGNKVSRRWSSPSFCW